MQGLMPDPGKTCQEYRANSLGIRQAKSLHLPIENDDLLPQHGNFNHQISPAVGQVNKNARRE